MRPPMSIGTSVRLSTDTRSEVLTYPDRGPIWSLSSRHASYRTSLSLHMDEDVTPDGFDRLAERFETDAREFVDALRTEAERIRTNQRSGVSKVAAASGGGGDG